MKFDDLLSTIPFEFIYLVALIALFCLATTSILKNILFDIPYIDNRKHLKDFLCSVFTGLNYVIGGTLGYYILPYAFPAKVLIGCVGGWLSPIIYRLVINLVIKKADIRVTTTLDPANTSTTIRPEKGV